MDADVAMAQIAGTSESDFQSIACAVSLAFKVEELAELTKFSAAEHGPVCRCKTNAQCTAPSVKNLIRL